MATTMLLLYNALDQIAPLRCVQLSNHLCGINYVMLIACKNRPPRRVVVVVGTMNELSGFEEPLWPGQKQR